MNTPRSRGPYAIDFALIVLTGNMTRYLNLRPVVDADITVRPRWYPIRTWETDDWLRFLPGRFRIRARHALDSWKLFACRPAEAVVVHAFETYGLYGVWHGLLRLRTVIVSNTDDNFNPRSRIGRWILDRAIDRTSLFVAFSTFAADEIRRTYPRVAERIRVLHPGLPLDKWPLREPPPRAERFRLLFVGGDAPRKGIDTLLDAFEAGLADTCELAVATQRGYLTAELEERLFSTAGVKVFLDLTPGSEDLRRLFREADAFVLPTRRDSSSWVALEAMATGIPVIITGIGGIPDIVRDEETGLLIEPGDVDGLVRAVRRLESSPELVERLVQQGRDHVEQSFDLHANTAHLLHLTKQLVDRRRQICRERTTRRSARRR